MFAASFRQSSAKCLYSGSFSICVTALNRCQRLLQPQVAIERVAASLHWTH
jgi:hypothetical protein